MGNKCVMKGVQLGSELSVPNLGLATASNPVITSLSLCKGLQQNLQLMPLQLLAMHRLVAEIISVMFYQAHTGANELFLVKHQLQYTKVYDSIELIVPTRTKTCKEISIEVVVHVLSNRPAGCVCENVTQDANTQANKRVHLHLPLFSQKEDKLLQGTDVEFGHQLQKVATECGNLKKTWLEQSADKPNAHICVRDLVFNDCQQHDPFTFLHVIHLLQDDSPFGLAMNLTKLRKICLCFWGEKKLVDPNEQMKQPPVLCNVLRLFQTHGVPIFSMAADSKQLSNCDDKLGILPRFDTQGCEVAQIVRHLQGKVVQNEPIVVPALLLGSSRVSLTMQTWQMAFAEHSNTTSKKRKQTDAQTAKCIVAWGPLPNKRNNEVQALYDTKLFQASNIIKLLRQDLSASTEALQIYVLQAEPKFQHFDSLYTLIMHANRSKRTEVQIHIVVMDDKAPFVIANNATNIRTVRKHNIV